MTEFNCNKRCGICCIVCAEIGITKEEYESREFKMTKSVRKFMRRRKGNGWSGRRLKLKAKYIPELNLLRKVCFYFDPIEKECGIYDSRPDVCRGWNCKGEWEGMKEKGKEVMKNWKKLLKYAKELGEWKIRNAEQKAEQ